VGAEGQAVACDPELAHVAQPVEHTLGKGVAMGSNPIVGSIRYSNAGIGCNGKKSDSHGDHIGLHGMQGAQLHDGEESA
jgi:hypothetical protein